MKTTFKPKELKMTTYLQADMNVEFSLTTKESAYGWSCDSIEEVIETIDNLEPAYMMITDLDAVKGEYEMLTSNPLIIGEYSKEAESFYNHMKDRKSVV